MYITRWGFKEVKRYFLEDQWSYTDIRHGLGASHSDHSCHSIHTSIYGDVHSTHIVVLPACRTFAVMRSLYVGLTTARLALPWT